MHHQVRLNHRDLLDRHLGNQIKQKGIIQVANNLNQYLSYEKAQKEITVKKGSARVQKASADVQLGRIAEEAVVYLLEKYFAATQLNYSVNLKGASQEHQDGWRHGLVYQPNPAIKKLFDVDIAIHNPTNPQKYFLLSCKGTARERIGQFIANLILLDERLIKEKYKDRFWLEHKKEELWVKYGFVCLDWARNKDFIKYTPSGEQRKTLKQLEVLLVNEDYYLGGGVTVLNNLENLDGVINFGGLVGRIADFLNTPGRTK